MIPSGVILIWPSTNATIPDGWVRETALDGRFLKGTQSGVNPNVQGGSSTHTHTSPTHSHTLNHHTHSIETTRDSDYETHGGGETTNVARDAHIHTGTTSTTSGGNLNNSITYQAASSLPPYTDVIFIKSESGYAALQDGIVSLFSKTVVPDGYAKCDGQNGTIDLRNKYLRGAATDQDAGTTGGSLTHSHSVNHTHSTVSHTHTGTSGLDSDSGNRNAKNTAGAGGVCARHSHTIYLNNNSAESSSAYSGTAGSAETVEPAYKKLMAIQNISGEIRQPHKGMIGLWIGNLIDIPIGWFHCDGNKGTPDMRSRYAKITDQSGEIGAIGGSHTHTHAPSNSHTHSATAQHRHSGYTSYKNTDWGTNADNDGAAKAHSHQINIDKCSYNTSTWQSTTIQADSSNNEPPHTTVAFLEFQFLAQAGVVGMLV